MLTVRLLNAMKKAPVGTPGSAAVQRGFDVRIETKPNFQAYRVAVVWTQNGWQTVNYTECDLVEVRNDIDSWAASISFFSEQPITFFYALAAAQLRRYILGQQSGLELRDLGLGCAGAD